LAGYLVPHIAQHGKSEFVFFLGAQGMVRQLRRDGDDLRRKVLKLRQRSLEAPQVQIAIGAPAAPVKDEDHPSTCFRRASKVGWVGVANLPSTLILTVRGVTAV